MKPVPKVKDGRTTIQLNYMMMIMKKSSNFINLLCNSSAFTSIWVIPELDLYTISSRCSSRQALLGDTGVVHCNPFEGHVPFEALQQIQILLNQLSGK